MTENEDKKIPVQNSNDNHEQFVPGQEGDKKAKPSAKDSLAKVQGQLDGLKGLSAQSDNPEASQRINEKLKKLGVQFENGPDGKPVLKVGQDADLDKISKEIDKMQNAKKSPENEFVSFADGKEGFEKGKEINIDFKGNLDKQESVGLAEVMPKEVRQVRIQGEYMGKHYDVVGVRQGPKGGFFDQKTGEYLPIYSGFKVSVVERDENAYKDFDKNKEENMKAYLDMPQFRDFAKKSPDAKVATEKLLSKALEYNIDPYFLFSQFQEDLANKAKGKNTGFFGEGGKAFDDKVNMSMRDLQIAMSRYKDLSKKDPTQNREFTNEFLDFYHSTYQSEGEGRSPERSVKSIDNYKKFFGKSFSKQDYEQAHAGNANVYQGMQSGAEFKGPVELDSALKAAKPFLERGTHYQRGGNSINGIDCSHLVCKVTNQPYQTAAGLSKWGRCSDVGGDNNVKPGDFMFWNKNPRAGGQQQNPISHVAMVLEAPKNGRVKILQSTSNANVHGANIIQGNPKGVCIAEIPIRHESVGSGGTNHFFKRPNIYTGTNSGADKQKA